MNLDKEQFNELINAFKRIQEYIRRVLNDVEELLYEAREAIDSIKKIRKTWHVPKNTTRNHQVINRKPMHSRIRNNI